MEIINYIKEPNGYSEVEKYNNKWNICYRGLYSGFKLVQEMQSEEQREKNEERWTESQKNMGHN